MKCMLWKHEMNVFHTFCHLYCYRFVNMWKEEGRKLKPTPRRILHLDIMWFSLEWEGRWDWFSECRSSSLEGTDCILAAGAAETHCRPTAGCCTWWRTRPLLQHHLQLKHPHCSSIVSTSEEGSRYNSSIYIQGKYLLTWKMNLKSSLLVVDRRIVKNSEQVYYLICKPTTNGLFYSLVVITKFSSNKARINNSLTGQQGLLSLQCLVTLLKCCGGRFIVSCLSNKNRYYLQWMVRW